MYVKKEKNIELFDKNRIRNAIISAYNQIGIPDFQKINNIVDDLVEEIANWSEELIDVKDIENIVMSYLYKELPLVAREYSSYKMNKERAKKNPSEIEKVLFVDPEIEHENGNKNPHLVHIKNAYLAEIPSKEMMMKLLPKECVEAHNKSIVYFHDSSYSAREMINCCLYNLEELFKGCMINGVYIETPKSFQTACTVASQALSHATSCQYGGITINLLHLAKFVDVSRQKIRKEVDNELNLVLDNISDSYDFNYEVVREKIVEKRLQKEIRDGMQTFLYQTNTLCSGTGQAAFLSVSCWLNEDERYANDLILVFKELVKQRIKGIKQEDGTYLNPNFPKILYFLDEDTMKGGKYYYITRMCAECSSKRLVPDYLSVKKHEELKGVPTPPMGCRSLLNEWIDENGNHVTWGRCNMGVQTINLPYVAMENNKERSEEQLFKNLEYYVDIAQRDMLWRANHVAKFKAGNNPLHFVYGGILRLNPNETLEKYVYNGYFSISLGYAGLREAVYYITGEDQFGEKGNKLAHKIIDYLNERNEQLKNDTGLAAGLYGTPMEVGTEKFANACIRDFGEIGDGTRNHFITNSYHHHVMDSIDAFTKLKDEAQFSDKTTSGSISYVEVPNLSNNLDAMLEIIEYIGNNCLYAEINSEISVCNNCGFQGYDFKKITADDGTVRWKCPKCGESDPNKIKTSYRICGYISNYTPNQGRSEDIINRVKHLNID